MEYSIWSFYIDIWSTPIWSLFVDIWSSSGDAIKHSIWLIFGDLWSTPYGQYFWTYGVLVMKYLIYLIISAKISLGSHIQNFVARRLKFWILVLYKPISHLSNELASDPSEIF